MANLFDSIPEAEAAAARGFQVRDLVRFFLVDIIVILFLKLLLFLGLFTTPDTYVLAILASKIVLFAYLVWLIRDRRDAWPETGAISPGRWWAWPASLVVYAACYPLLLWVNVLNHALMKRLYDWLGWVYTPTPQDVMVLIFDNILDAPVRLGLVFFAILAGPFMEELAFRGMGLDAFGRASGRGVAIFWTSLLFGLYHFDLSLVLPLSILGALFAAVRIMSGTLWCAVMVHVLHNTLVLLIMAVELGRLKLPGW